MVMEHALGRISAVMARLTVGIIQTKMNVHQHATLLHCGSVMMVSALIGYSGVMASKTVQMTTLMNTYAHQIVVMISSGVRITHVLSSANDVMAVQSV